MSNPNNAAITTNTLTVKAKRAIRAYSAEVCASAWESHINDGYGANTIGNEHGLTTNQADAAINAGEEMAEKCDGVFDAAAKAR